MGKELKHTYTIRIPEQVAALIEETARIHGIAPTTFIQLACSPIYPRL